jgi:hypothetical protein
MFDADADLFARSRAYVEAIATPRDTLAAASGVSERALADIEAAGALPAPTYVLFDNAIRSPIRVLGEPPEDGGRAFYCPPVVHWLRRAKLIGADRKDVLPRLEAWFADDFAAALRAQAQDARQFAWAHLFDATGEIAPDALAAQVQILHQEWMNGGWAVCLRRWNGHHVVTKDLERARIGALTGDAARDLNAADRQTLFNAIERLDSVMLPFAPHERPHGTPGLFVDRMRERYGV